MQYHGGDASGANKQHEKRITRSVRFDLSLISKCFAGAPAIFVEKGLIEPDWLETFAEGEDKHVLAMSSRTASANGVSRAVTFGIGRHLNISKDVGERVQTALQEAIVNAVAHGNLALSSQIRRDLPGCEQFERMIAERLKVSVYAALPLAISVTAGPDAIDISVKDSGAGYSIRESFVTSDASLFGRGLKIIGAMADSVMTRDGGRQISMRFVL